MVISEYRLAGGHETVINNLCIGLRRLGYDTKIGAFSFAINPPNNIQGVKLNKLRTMVLGLNEEKFDIIHNHHTTMNYFSLVSHQPFVFHYHGASNKIQEINLKASLSLCRKRISRIISVSNFALNHLRNIAGKFSLRIPSEVIYNGVDTSYYHTNLPKPYTSGDPQLLFVGNLYPHKNVSSIIEAMPSIIELYPNVHLQIVGHGQDYQTLKNQVKEKRLQKNVEVVGAISNEELRLRYSSCDIYVSASRFEQYVLPPVEAMACGKPALLSDILPHKELVEASAAGRCFTLSDNVSIQKTLEELYVKRKYFSTVARRFAEKYDWSEVCQKVASVYDQITGSR